MVATKVKHLLMREASNKSFCVCKMIGFERDVQKSEKRI